MADDSDEDPVVKEVDVFLSKSLSDNLYLMQYPLRPRNVGYDQFDHLAARVKPQQKKVELVLSLDTRSKNYSSSKGEQIAVNVDGSLPPDSAERYFSGSKMNKMVVSCPPMTDSFTGCQYAMGLLRDGELHLTPVSAVVQMRPSLDYLDTADVRCKAEAANQSLGDGGESSQDEAEEEATPVSMKVTRGESEEFKARRMASYEYIHQRREEERWVNVTYFGADSGVSEAEREQLKAGDVPRVSQFKISPQEYLQALIPPSSESKSEAPAMPDNVLSLSDLRRLDLTDQIRALLINVKVIRFSQLMSFLAPGADHQAVLRSLQSMAVLVQGCWVVKSELLYPEEDKEEAAKKRRPHSGVSPELLRRVRDYAMWKFTHCKYVVRKDISSIVQLPSDDVKEILEKMSRLKLRSGWEFFYEYDRDFCERHPEIVQRQRNKWALTFHSLAQHFKMPKDGEKKALELEMALMNLQPTERHRTRRLSSRSPRKRTLSGRSMSDVSDLEVDPASGERAGDAVDVALNGATAHAARNLTNGLVGGIPGEVNADGDPGGTLTRQLETFLREVLSESSLLSMSEIRSKLSMYTARVPAAHVFSAGVSDRMIEDAVAAIGGHKLNNQWPANKKPDPLFAAWTGNDTLDKLRQILFSLFEESPKIRSASFRAAVLRETGVELSEAEMKKVLKDHCDSHAASWYLKRTMSSNS
ncbi:DNA-directed RNA polymerase III subunit RPC5 [Aplysia californica]|uniref:DNA-directed RNA polymerase III subunit RPC5 n=1 Tax=Aplysia californica TaxID=6500 RepID=A0ABM1ABE7_APLCA|nr:DNA-directed RNA polymerase III subunit RPC5 [Aplysia californica]